MVLNLVLWKAQVSRILITGTRDRMSLGNYKDTVMILPPLEEQCQINSPIETIAEKLAATVDYIGQLTHIRSAVSQGLLTGRILLQGGK
jgi:restriction endonuclease S subunit